MSVGRENVGGGFAGADLGKKLKNILCPGARIVLYGCGTAYGDGNHGTTRLSGKSFVEELAENSGATVRGTPTESRCWIDKEGNPKVGDENHNTEGTKLWEVSPDRTAKQVTPPGEGRW